MAVHSVSPDINKLVNVKRYGTAYKLTLLKCLPNDIGHSGNQCNEEEKRNGKHKLDCNISRARSKIFELAMCNEWEYFGTFTLDKEKYNRSDLEIFQADLSRFIRDQRRKWRAAEIKYLLIPELHGDLKNWHMHGLMGGLRNDMLSRFVPGKHPAHLVNNGFLNWRDYAEKFGFISLGIIKSNEQVSKYITKYITKDVAKSVQEVGGHMYYRSKGLNGLEVIKKGTLAEAPSHWDYENDYVKILWINPSDVNKYVK